MVSRRPDGRSAAATQTRYVALAAAQLGGLAGDVAQPRQHRAGGGQQAVLAGGGGQLGEPGAEHEAALHVAGDEAVVLERDGEPVRGGPGQPGAGDQAGQGGRPGLQGGEHEGGLVEDADSARVVHTLILPSHIMECKLDTQSESSESGDGDSRTQAEESVMGRTLAREGLGRARRPHAPQGEPDLLYIDLHLVHEVTSPQAFDGLRLAGRAGAPPRPHARHRGPQRPRPSTSTSRSPTRSSRTQVETLRTQRRGVRRPAAPARRRRAGHRARRRPAARPDPARHDDRLRRLAHLAPTAPSARWRSASAPARSSTCSPPRRCRRPARRPWRSPSTASCPTASPPRT